MLLVDSHKKITERPWLGATETWCCCKIVAGRVAAGAAGARTSVPYGEPHPIMAGRVAAGTAGART